ncbi:hypothetical protein [Lysobacter hankyongensis]
MKTSRSVLFLALLAASASSPAQSPSTPPAARPAPAAPAPGVSTSLLTHAFMTAINRHCGNAYAGRVLVDTPATPDSPFAGKPLVMHVRDCGDDEVRIPFHVGEDHSRTWVFLRVPAGLQLKHDHRHEDGSPDAVTMYGGDSSGGRLTNKGLIRIEFPVDAESIASFKANGLPASVANTWAVELSQDRFVYELSRPNGRLFRVEFDLANPVVPLPPPPWGTTP